MQFFILFFLLDIQAFLSVTIACITIFLNFITTHTQLKNNYRWYKNFKFLASFFHRMLFPLTYFPVTFYEYIIKISYFLTNTQMVLCYTFFSIFPFFSWYPLVIFPYQYIISGSIILVYWVNNLLTLFPLFWTCRVFYIFATINTAVKNLFMLTDFFTLWIFPWARFFILKNQSKEYKYFNDITPPDKLFSKNMYQLTWPLVMPFYPCQYWFLHVSKNLLIIKHLNLKVKKNSISRP